MSMPRFAAALIACTGLALPPGTQAQDLYDTTTLRTFALTFHDANWLSLLRNSLKLQCLLSRFNPPPAALRASHG